MLSLSTGMTVALCSMATMQETTVTVVEEGQSQVDGLRGRPLTVSYHHSTYKSLLHKNEEMNRRTHSSNSHSGSTWLSQSKQSTLVVWNCHLLVSKLPTIINLTNYRRRRRRLKTVCPANACSSLWQSLRSTLFTPQLPLSWPCSMLSIRYLWHLCSYYL